MSNVFDPYTTGGNINPFTPDSAWGTCTFDRTVTGTIGSGSAVLPDNGVVRYDIATGTCDMPTGTTKFRITVTNNEFVDIDFTLFIVSSSPTQTINHKIAPGGPFTQDYDVGTTLTGITAIQWYSQSEQPATMGTAAAEPHVVCADGTRLELYANGIFRFFEDPAHRVCVNIGVLDTFITFASVMVDGEIVGRADFDVASSVQLHADHILLDGRRAPSGDVTIDTEAYTVVVQMEYRCVHIQRKQRPEGPLTLGGALAAIVHQLQMEDDATPGPTRALIPNAWAAHALVCDAFDPHVVSFFGARVVPGAGEHILFQSDTTVVHAELDDFSRIRRLWTGNLDATWTRHKPKEKGLQHTSLVVQHNGERKEVMDLMYEDCVLPLGGGGTGGELLVRMQSNGAASFALRGQRVVGEGCSGILLAKAAVPEGAQRGRECSYYERNVEPHLAWSAGRTVEAACINCVGGFCAV